MAVAYVKLKIDSEGRAELVQTGKDFDDTGKKAASAQAVITKACAGIKAGLVAAAAAAAAVGAGVLASVNHLLDMAGKMTDLSQVTGIAVTDLQAFEVAGSMVGVGAEAIADSMVKLQRKMVEGSAATRKALSDIGLGLEDVRKMTAGEQMSAILQGLSKIEDEAKRNALAVELLGKSGAKLVPLGADFEAIRKRAEDLGIIMSRDVVKAADDLGDSVGMLGMTFGGLSNNVAAAIVTSEPLHALIEGLTDIMGQLSIWVRQNQSDIRAYVDGGVVFLLQALIQGITVIEVFAAAWKALLDTWTYVKTGALMLVETLKLQFKVMTQPWKASQFWEEYKRGIDSITAEAADDLQEHQKSLDGFVGLTTKVKGVVEGLRDKVAGLAGVQHAGAGAAKAHGEGMKAGAEAAVTYKRAIEEATEALRKSEQEIRDAEVRAKANEALMAGPPAALIRVVDTMQKRFGDGHLTDLMVKPFVATRKEIEGVNTKLSEAVEKTMDWQGLLGALTNVFDALGVKADNVLSRMVAGFLAGKAAAQSIAPVLARLKDSIDKDGKVTKGVKFVDLENAEKGKTAIAGLTAAVTAYKSGVLGGAAAGAAFGASFGPIGAGIGAVAGGLLGFLGRGKQVREELQQMRAEFIRSAGGIKELEWKAMEAGVSLDAFFRARNAAELANAINQVKDSLAAAEEATEALQQAMDKYGFTAAEVPQMAQKAMDDMAASLLKNYQLLVAGGADVTLVQQRMAADFSAYVQQAIASGTAIPESMRPIIDSMIKQGLLLKANGEAYTEAEAAGITYTESLSAGLARAVDAINRLVDALLKIPDRTVTVTTNFVTNGSPSPGQGSGSHGQQQHGDGSGGGGTFDPSEERKPYGARAGGGWMIQRGAYDFAERGPELAVPAQVVRDGGMVGGVRIGGGGGVTFHIGELNVMSPDPSRAGQDVLETLKDVARNNTGNVLADLSAGLKQLGA